MAAREADLYDDHDVSAGEDVRWLASALDGEAAPACGCYCACRQPVDDPDDLRCFACLRGEHRGPRAADHDPGAADPPQPPLHRTGHWWSWRR